MSRLINFMFGGGLWGNLVAASLGLAVLVAGWQLDRWAYGVRQRQAGATRARVNIEKANAKAAQHARRAARGVVDRRVRGVVDPNAVAQ